MMLKTLLIKLGPAIDASGESDSGENDDRDEVPAVEEFESGICPSQEVPKKVRGVSDEENGGGSEKETLEEGITIKEEIFDADGDAEMREEAPEKENKVAVEHHSEVLLKIKPTDEEENIEEAEVKCEQFEPEVECDPIKVEEEENREDDKHAGKDSNDVVISMTTVKCQTCAKEYCSRSYLRQHVEAVHLKLRPFQCLTCGHGFAEKKKLKRHVDAVHKKLKPFGCTVCGKYFAQRRDMKRHAENVHQNLRGSSASHLRVEFHDSAIKNPADEAIPYAT